MSHTSKGSESINPMSMINVRKIHIAVMAILSTLPIKVIKIYAASCR